MIGVHANRCFSGWGVSACYLRGYHDPDILFYRGSGALNQEWHWISVTFCCLTHLLHLNYSVDETTQHQSRRGFCTTRDCETLHLSLCINQVCVRTRVPECKRASVHTDSDTPHQCLHDRPTESQLAQNHWTLGARNRFGNRELREASSCFQGTEAFLCSFAA